MSRRIPKLQINLGREYLKNGQTCEEIVIGRVVIVKWGHFLVLVEGEILKNSSWLGGCGELRTISV